MDEQRRNTKRQVGVKDGHVDWKNQVFFAETFVLPTFATLSGNVSVGSTPMYEYAKRTSRNRENLSFEELFHQRVPMIPTSY